MIIVAAENEIQPAREYFGRIFKWDDIQVSLTGVGALNVIEALRGISRETPIYNFGYAGSNTLPIGTVVDVSTSQLWHPNADFKSPVYRLPGTIPCYTSNDFVLKADIERPAVFDMELAYIMAMGFINVRSIKIVSDNLSLKEYGEYEFKKEPATAG